MAYSVSASPNPVNENAGIITFTVARSSPNLGAETVFVSTAQTEGSTNSSDYSGLSSQSLFFSSGQTSAQVSVSVTDNTVVESDEIFGFIVQRNASDSASTFRPRPPGRSATTTRSCNRRTRCRRARTR